MDENNREITKDENFIPTGLPGGFFIYNARGNEEICFAEQNVIELFGCKTIEEFREFTGNSFKGMVHPDDLDKIENEILAQTFTSEHRHDYVRYRILTKQGDIRYIEDFGHLLHGEGGRSYYYVYIVDVDKDEYFNRSRNSFAESQIYSMNSGSDRLTGLLNMRSFYEVVQKLLSDSDARSDKHYHFIHFDIINFKIFNENYGFQRGDDLLCRMAYTIKNTFEGGYLARFSNDHFVVCTDADDVTRLVEHIHNTMSHILDNIRVEVKAGIYDLEDSCHEVGIACDHARLACSTVKRRYDRVFSVYDVGIHEKLRMQQFVVDNIDEAVEKGYIKVFYQPVIRVATGKICGYEALARWIDPKMGFLSPADFIPTLEEYRLIHKIDSYVIKKICEDTLYLLENGEPVVPVSVNLSRLDFELCDIFDITEGHRRLYDIPRNILDIEITESALNEESDHIKKEVKKFRSAGYHIWIDDFGSGYSSLNTLVEFDFDVLKLDLEFMRTFDKNPRCGELLKHIVMGACDLGVEPLQEGVETREHYDFLKMIGCERAQGYYFAKPMPLDESRAYTRANNMEWERY